MRKLLILLLIFLNIGLFGNPIIIKVPVISEFFYNQGNWQIELCIRSSIYEWLDIQSFDQLSLMSDAGQVQFQTYNQFSYDSVFVIDQSWFSSTPLINPIHDNLNIIFEVYTVWDGISYSPNPDTLLVSTPGANESVVVHYFDDGYHAYTMKQSPPSIGSSVFEVTSRSGISGYVYDQFLNPVPGLTINYYPSLYAWYAQPLHSILTDSNGYFESDDIFPMGYYVELKMYNYVLETDMMYFEPDTSYLKEYQINTTGIQESHEANEIQISANPNPFRDMTSFHISMPDEYNWSDLRITIYNLNGQVMDNIPISAAPWSSTNIKVDWFPSNTKHQTTPGLYIYTLMVDQKPTTSNKMIIYD